MAMKKKSSKKKTKSKIGTGRSIKEMKIVDNLLLMIKDPNIKEIIIKK